MEEHGLVELAETLQGTADIIKSDGDLLVVFAIELLLEFAFHDVKLECFVVLLEVVENRGNVGNRVEDVLALIRQKSNTHLVCSPVVF